MTKSKEPAKKATTGASLAFHWSYIVLPVAIFFLSAILTAYFYQRLPVEVAYHFESDGTPDKWLNRAVITLLVLLPQLFLTLLAGAVTWGVTRLSALFRQSGGTAVKPESFLSLMGNMIALPQIILCFAMLDIFSYNSYQIHIMPIWVFAVIIMGLGVIILGIFFIRAIRQAWVVNR